MPETTVRVVHPGPNLTPGIHTLPHSQARTLIESGIARPTTPPPAPRPPTTGPGSGRKAWADYATSQGLHIPTDATRDDIITLIDTPPTNT